MWAAFCRLDSPAHVIHAHAQDRTFRYGKVSIRIQEGSLGNGLGNKVIAPPAERNMLLVGGSCNAAQARLAASVWQCFGLI